MLPTAQASLPDRAGLGLKPEHFDAVLTTRPDLGFFEVHAENYMVDGGPMHHYLQQIRSHYPLSVHGVGMSLGSPEPVDKAHLQRLRTLLDRYQPEQFSEHLAWSAHQGQFLNDLLPLPYTESSLKQISAKVDQVQAALGRQMLLENPATYLEYSDSSLSETEFITELVKQSGCGLLLDLNNVHVACKNHGRDPLAYIQALPLTAVQEIHLAGFAPDAQTPLLIDSHDSPVAAEVWSLFEHTLQLTGPLPTLLERDANLPPLADLCREAGEIDSRLQACSREYLPSHA